jgi:glycosyltransferase involved in cell wall biosynthesis
VTRPRAPGRREGSRRRLLRAGVVGGAAFAAAQASGVWRARPPRPILADDASADGAAGLDAKSSLDVTMVIPYYNPGPRFAPSVGDLVAALGQEHISFEVIVVSDGSTDGSDNALDELGPEVTKWIRRIDLGTNRGKGEAVRIGLSQGRGRYLGFIDADGDIPAMQIKSLVDLVRTFDPDVVLGSKRHPLSEVHYPPARRMYSWGYQQIVRLLFHLNVRDTQTGLKLIRREVLAAVLPRTLEKRFAFDLEMLVVARRLGYRRFFEAPVHIQERFSSTIRLRSVRPMLQDTLAIFYRLRILRYYDKPHKPPTEVSGQLTAT